MFSARSAFCELFVHGFSLFKHQNLIVLKASQKKILKYEEDAKMGKTFTTFGVELEFSLVHVSCRRYIHSPYVEGFSNMYSKVDSKSESDILV